MRHGILFFGLTLWLLAGCRTLDMKESDLLQAPYSTLEGTTMVSAEAQCEANGGEYIEGFCVCEDGNAVTQKTCAQHIKENYPECYAKGGISKQWDGRNVCMCEHGEVIDPKTTRQNCYELFTEKNRGCAIKLGMLGVKDRACRCLHGTLTYQLPGGTTCEDDFRVQNTLCFQKGGVTLDPQGPCICRDGTYAEGEVVCPERWFFYTGKMANNTDTTQTPTPPPPSDNSSRIGENISVSCLCSNVVWQGKNYCMIYKVGEKNPLQYSQVPTAATCSLNHCYTHFQDAYQNACYGQVSFRATATAENMNMGERCECREGSVNGKRICGLYKNNQLRYSVYMTGQTACDANFCSARWGHDPYVRQYCSAGFF